MNPAAGPASGSPFVVAVTFPFPPDDDGTEAMAPLLALDDVEVVVTPYFESPELRTARGRNQGVAPAEHTAPEVDTNTLAVWARANALVSMDLPDHAAERFPQLGVMQCISAGVEHIDVAALEANGVALANASGIASEPIAEFVMARLLQVWKHLRVIEDQQRASEWAIKYGSLVSGKTLGVIGLGAIGREVARRARAFGMRVLATRASAQPGDTDPDVDELHPAAELDAVLGRCDAVVSVVPASPATVDLFDADRFAAMRPGSIFCNFGRGVHVDESALVAALESGHLGAAVLDVFRTEPLPPDDPLWAAPNTYLSPHSSVSLDRYAESIFELAADNIGRFRRGERLRNQVIG